MCCAATGSRIQATVVRKITERSGDHQPVEEERTIADLILDGEIAMIVNTPTGQSARADGYAIRAAANTADVTLITTVQEFAAAVQAIEALRKGDLTVTSLQDHAAALDLLGRGREELAGSTR